MKRPLTFVGLAVATAFLVAPAQAQTPSTNTLRVLNGDVIRGAAVGATVARPSLPALPGRAPSSLRTPLERAVSLSTALMSAVPLALPTHGSFPAWCSRPSAFMYPGWAYGLGGTPWTQVWWRPWWYELPAGEWHTNGGWYFAWANSSSEYTGKTSPWYVYWPNNPPGQEWQQLGVHGTNLWLDSPFMGLGIDVYAGAEYYWVDNANTSNQQYDFLWASSHQGPDAVSGHCTFP